MHANGFGSKSAEYIIEWAKLFHSKDNEQWNTIVQTGLVEEVQPIELLREYYNLNKITLKCKFMFNVKLLGNICFINSDETGYQYEEIRAVSFFKINPRI